jgi:hypothetical protein
MKFFLVFVFLFHSNKDKIDIADDADETLEIFMIIYNKVAA